MLLSYEEIQQEQTQHLNYRKKILDYRRNTQTWLLGNDYVIPIK